MVPIFWLVYGVVSLSAAILCELFPIKLPSTVSVKLQNFSGDVEIILG